MRRREFIHDIRLRSGHTAARCARAAARVPPDRQGRVAPQSGRARPVRNPAGLEPAPTH